MIRADKVDHALYALNGVLVHSRALACNDHDAEMLAEVLDYAEYLPLFMASPEDSTDEFRYMLEGLARCHPGFAIALDRFDADTTPAEWWT